MAEKYCYSHPRPAVTVDIVVLSRDGYVLLVKRKADPFKGCWALPGGFVEIDERLADAAGRELEEETGITGVELRQLRAFDEPGRDPRGRIICIAFVSVVDGQPKPKPGSDAAEARWLALEDLPPMAFDHDAIITCALEAVPVKAK